MRPTANRWRALLGLLALLLAFGATACELSEGDLQLIREFAEEWARSKKIHPQNPDGSVNLEGVANIGIREFGGSTGDDEADAAIDAGLVVKNIKEADELATDGYKNKDVKKLDQAIDKRPDDYVYRSQRGLVVYYQQGPNAAKEDFNKADQLAQSQGKAAQELNLRTRMQMLMIHLTAPLPQAPTGDLGDQYCKDQQAYRGLTGRTLDLPVPVKCP